MGRTFKKLRRDLRGAVAPTVALSLFGLIAAGGIAFDYARMATLDTELQQAADQAALAAATQLDGRAGALSRADAAARNLISNDTLFANDSGGSNSGGGITAQVDTASDTQAQGYTANQQAVVFYKTRADAEADANGFDVASGRDSEAHFVRIRIETRSAHFALTPIVGAMSADMTAQATAGLGSAICKVPPVMICNPQEPAGNGNERLAYTATRGMGLRLITGNADVPGNFGWLDAGLANGSNALAAALGYNAPPGDCQPIDGVTTKTGMDTAVLKALNTRFDVYANGNSACPSQGGGSCNPAVNTRKDLTCKRDNTGTGCNGSWGQSSTPYKLPTTTVCTRRNPQGNCTQTQQVAVERALTTGDTYPDMMGYPHDICQSQAMGSGTCPGAEGNGTWDRDAYFKVNYGWDNATWKSQTGLTDTGSNKASRWDVYQWELTHQNVSGKGIAVRQDIGQNSAFSKPTGQNGAGVAASATQADRRRISAAVLNCIALNAHGKTVGAPVTTWLDLFLVEPAISRTTGVITDQKEVYVEVIGVTTAAGNNAAGQVVRRDLPYLIK